MKISLTYQREEISAAAYLIALIQTRYPGSKLHKSEQHTPFIHAYLTVREPDKPNNKAGLR